MNDYYHSIYFFLVFSDIMLFCNFCMHKYNYTHMLFFLISHHNLRDLWKYRILITHIYFKVWKILHWGRLTKIDITILILWSLFSLLIIWSDDYSLYLVFLFFFVYFTIFSQEKFPEVTLQRTKVMNILRILTRIAKLLPRKVVPMYTITWKGCMSQARICSSYCMRPRVLNFVKTIWTAC